MAKSPCVWLNQIKYYQILGDENESGFFFFIRLAKGNDYYTFNLADWIDNIFEHKARALIDFNFLAEAMSEVVMNHCT